MLVEMRLAKDNRLTAYKEVCSNQVLLGRESAASRESR